MSASIPVAVDRTPSRAATASRALQKIRKSKLTPKNFIRPKNPNSWPHKVLHSIDSGLVYSGSSHLTSHLKKPLPLKPSIWEREETICLKENNQREHSNNLPRASSSRYWMESKHSTFCPPPQPNPTDAASKSVLWNTFNTLVLWNIFSLKLLKSYHRIFLPKHY